LVSAPLPRSRLGIFISVAPNRDSLGWRRGLERGHHIPTKGDRIEQTNLGIRRAGVVWYADQLQVLVEWDDGRSSSLRIGRDGFRIIEDVEQRKAS
jgi:hypothetical protein